MIGLVVQANSKKTANHFLGWVCHRLGQQGVEGLTGSERVKF